MSDLNQDKTFSTTRLLKKSEVPFVGNFKKYGGLRTEGWRKESIEGAPVISIITAVRNDVANIEKTILSVLNQTYSNVEYVVIDGDSTDGTLDIIKKYEKYIDVWVSEHDGGIFYAFNKGIDLVTGKWVQFLNCDDWFYNNTVLEEIFVGRKIDVDAVYGNMVGILNGQKVLSESREYVKKNAWQGQWFVHETLFIKTEIRKKFKFDTRYKVSGDGDFVLKCLANGYEFKKINVIVIESGPQGFSGSHWLQARKENWLITRKYYPGFKTDFRALQGLVYFVVFRFFKQVLSAVGVYDFLKKYYRRWFGDKIMREKYRYTVIDDKKY